MSEIAFSSAVAAWTNHFAHLWKQRIQDYGRMNMQKNQSLTNKFVTHEVLERVNTELKMRNIPITIWWCSKDTWINFQRPPTINEINVVHGNLINLADDSNNSVNDPLTLINQYLPRRLLTMVHGWDSLSLDMILLEVEANDIARGGKIFLSHEGNSFPPFNMTVPGITKVDNFSLNIWRFETTAASYDKFLSEKVVTLRLHDKNDKLLSILVGAIASLFEYRIVR